MIDPPFPRSSYAKMVRTQRYYLAEIIAMVYGLRTGRYGRFEMDPAWREYGLITDLPDKICRYCDPSQTIRAPIVRPVFC